MLADNTFFAFNDFLQLLIENGIIGCLLLLVGIFFLVIQIKRLPLTPANKHFVVASIASLICISTASFFSYCFQIFPIMLHAIICVALLNVYPTESNKLISVSFLKTQLFKVAFIIISILLTTHMYFLMRHKRQSHEAFELSLSGFKKESLREYQSLSESYIKDGSTLYAYARELYACNYLSEALVVLKMVKKYYCTNELYKLSARVANELQNHPEAEADFTAAVYMVPNRMLSRHELLLYYVNVKDTAKAIYWAGSILEMPVKIPSNLTTRTREQTATILNTLQ